MKLKIGAKILLSFAIVILVMLGLGIYNLIQVGVLKSFEDEGAGRAHDAVVLEEMVGLGNKLYSIMADAIINQDFAVNRKLYDEISKEIETDMEELHKLVDTDAERKLADKADEILTEYKDSYDNLIKLVKAGETVKIKDADAELDELKGEFEEAIVKIAKSLEEEMDEAAEEYDAVSANVSNITIILLCVGFVFAVGVTIILTRAITKPLIMGVDFAKSVAQGDLTVKLDIKTKDEIGDLATALNQTVDNLKMMMGQVMEASDQVAASSEQLSSSAQNLSEGAQKQASSLEETSSSMEEMSSSVEQVSEKAQNQAASVEEVSSSMEELSTSVKGVAETAQKVKKGGMDAVAQAGDAEQASQMAIDGMKKIEESSSKINNIISVINDIADQTNLLALNASIEAARAGDAGRGFAVVAKEISNLADKSASATQEIAQLINETGDNVVSGSEMVKQLDGAIKKMKEVSEAASNYGGEMANASEEQLTGFKQITDSIQDVNAMAQAIASSSEEQSSTAEEMGKTIEGVNQLTQQAASSAEEMASSTEELSSQAESLKQVVGQFKI